MCNKFKRSKSFILLLLVLLACSLHAHAQNTVTGTVTDTHDEPLPGVSVQIKGSTTGTITNLDGHFEINASPKDYLVFTYLGMKTQEIRVGTQRSVRITMQDDVALLDEVVVVAYGTQKRGNITGSVSTVSGNEILKAPIMGLSNVVGARVSGIAAVQSSGQPGSDNASLTVRGQGNVIYVIDGIVRTSADFNGLDPNEVESVTVLKDASAVALYGLDASAAMLVTTRKGSTDKMSISYTGSYGISQNAEQQLWLDGPGYAYWYNKARELQGDTPVFTDAMVQKMREGKDGFGSTDWYGKVFGTGTRTAHNLSTTGGTQKMKVFASIGYLDEEGNIDNYNYNRMNLRSNIDAKLTSNLTFNLGISGRVEKREQPRYSANPNDWHNVPQQTIRALPYVQDTYEFEGKTYNVSTHTNSSNVAPLAAINESGYSQSSISYIRTNMSLQYDAPWLKGLSFKFTGAYDALFNFGKTLTNPFEVMIATLDVDKAMVSYTKGFDSAGNTISLSEQASRSYQLTTQSSVAYDNKFGKHAVSALALMETRENKSNQLSAAGSGLDFIQLDELSKITNKTGNGETRYPTIGGYSGMTRVAGFVGRLNYNYDEKYYAEFAMRYDGSYLFGGMNQRWAAFPGVSAGWRLSQEDWFKTDWINNLKVRAGIGKTGTSSVSAFQWMNTMAMTTNSVILGPGSQTMIYASVLGNPNLKWAEAVNYNFGIDATLWNGLLGIEFDVFYKYEYDILATTSSGSFPPSRGGYYVTSGNYNKRDYKGYDMTLTHRNKIGDFNYGVKLILSYAYGRWLYVAGDSDNAYEYQRLTGKQVGVKYGFIADGLYQTAEDLANHPNISGKPAQLGYIKYVDRNGDGIVTDAADQGYVGKSAIPTHTGSVDLFGAWKGFDFDLLFSYGLGNSVALTGVYTSTGSAGVQDNTAFTKPFYHGGNSPVFLVENAWTPEHTDAEFPRLEIDPANSNNAYSSTFWYRNGDYLRLKTAQIGYSLPERWLKSTGVDAVRIYVEGYNLLTFSGLTKYNIDPEAPAVNNGYYPQQRTMSMGVKLTF